MGKEEEEIRVQFNCSFDLAKTVGSYDVFRTGINVKMTF